MITCVIPTRNESDNLVHAMRSLRWCDEVIVVDMESTDGTPDLARALGARVIPVAPTPDFNMSRKVGLDAARNEWVLALDADEMVPPTLAERILAIANAHTHDVVLVPRTNYKFGRQVRGGLWPDYQRRLYRRGAVEFVSATHDYLRMRSRRILVLPEDPALSLQHFNYIPVERQVEKLNAYTSADAIAAPAGAARASRWRPAKTFVSCYFRHGARREGVPGFWWSAYMAFYVLVEQRKRFAGGGAKLEATGREIEALNRETDALATARPAHGGAARPLSPASAAATFLRELLRGGSRDSRLWRAALATFHQITLGMKRWELAGGRSMAERSQDEGRMELAARWAALGR